MTSGRPRVSVPVLSKAITLACPISSKTAPLFMSTPDRADRAIAATIEIGRGYHQCAGATDKEEHKPAVHPLLQRLLECQPGHDCDQRGQYNEFRRIVGGKAVDELRGRGFFFLRGFYEAHNAGDCIVGCRSRGCDFHVSLLVDCARKDAVAACLRNRSALSCNRGLVYGRFANDHLTIYGHTFTGANHHSCANRHAIYGNCRFPPIDLDAGLFRGEFHQSVDGIVRPIQRKLFQHFAEREEKDHRGPRPTIAPRWLRR